MIAAAATGGAMGNVLDVIKGSQNAAEILALVERSYDVVIRNLLAVTNRVIFHNDLLKNDCIENRKTGVGIHPRFKFY